MTLVALYTLATSKAAPIGKGTRFNAKLGKTVNGKFAMSSFLLLSLPFKDNNEGDDDPVTIAIPIIPTGIRVRSVNPAPTSDPLLTVLLSLAENTLSEKPSEMMPAKPSAIIPDQFAIASPFDSLVRLERSR
jgi:hypothetical protein